MGPIAPFAIGVATAALARKFFQAKAHYEDIANRARRIQILTTLSDMKFRNMSIAEAAFKDARSTYHAGLAGLNAMREIVDEIRYTQDAFTKNLPSLGQAES
jgi:DICT domain-containing protein